MRGLTVLLAHSELVTRSGAELYVADIATGLSRRGHAPIVYAPRLGRLAVRLREATIPVADDIGAVTATPDVICGQTNLELLVAMLRFPGVPAIRICHSCQDERPWVLPGVARYVCVDDTTRDRALGEWALPADRTLVLLNFADLDRFALRATLPPRPRRALIFSNNAAAHLDVVRRACARHGVAVAALGLSVDAPSEAPETVISSYDVVFAKARCAIEALATGAAVVLCDAAGAGPMVTTANLPDLRRMNFGLRALSEPLGVEWLSAQLARYDATDAHAVALQVRAMASSDTVIDRFAELCEATAALAERPAPGDLMREAARCLASLGPRLRWAQSPRAALYACARSGYFRLERVPGLRLLLMSRTRAQRWQRRMRR